MAINLQKLPDLGYGPTTRIQIRSFYLVNVDTDRDSYVYALDMGAYVVLHG